MNIRTLAGMVVAAFVGTAPASDDSAKDPLLGEWREAGTTRRDGGAHRHLSAYLRETASGMHGMFIAKPCYARVETGGASGR